MFGAWSHSLDKKNFAVLIDQYGGKKQFVACRPLWRSSRPHNVFRYQTSADSLVPVVQIPDICWQFSSGWPPWQQERLVLKISNIFNHKLRCSFFKPILLFYNYRFSIKIVVGFFLLMAKGLYVTSNFT